MQLKNDAFGENRLRTIKSVLFALLCLPAAAMLFDVISGQIGAEPIKELTYRSGEWALRILLLTLAITPLKRATGWNRLIRFRRLLGLFSFFYMVVHFGIYLVLDQYFYWPDIVQDLTERPYIIAGFSCLVLCLPLAVTSTNGMVRRLGGKSWKRLHTLVYPAGVAAVLHFLWLVKADITEPLIYAIILAILLGSRLRFPGNVYRTRQKMNLGT